MTWLRAFLVALTVVFSAGSYSLPQPRILAEPMQAAAITLPRPAIKMPPVKLTVIAPPAASTPALLRLYLTGDYTDCTGATPLKAGLWRDVCMTNGTYLVAHKWSTGSSFFGLHVGSQVIYAGRSWTAYKVFTEPASASATYGYGGLTLQTCWDDAGKTFFIIELR